MPIQVDSEIRILEKREYHELAHLVMAHVFAVHNEFSRLMDELPFKTLIQRRFEENCRKSARREVEILVTHGTFRKSYYMDLLFEGALMVEAKVVDALSDAHKAQAIQYLLLSGMHDGLLVNLRTPRVQKHFVSTSLNSQTRREFVVDDSEWQRANSGSDRLRVALEDLLEDWGLFLGLPLYREALGHLLGGAQSVFRRIALFDGQRPFGMHDVCLVDHETMFTLTALKEGKDEMRSQLERLLGHTELRCMQWINFDRHHVKLTTISN